jgi:hypothetical protein
MTEPIRIYISTGNQTLARTHNDYVKRSITALNRTRLSIAAGKHTFAHTMNQNIELHFFSCQHQIKLLHAQ